MKLKYNIFFLLSLTFMASCSDNEEVYDPGLKFATTGDVRFMASIENCGSTRASLINTGEARWLGEDAIGLVCTDGTVATLPLDGTGDTRKAVFSGTIPNGKTLGEFAVHPADVAVNGKELSINLPSEIVPNSYGSCSLMIAPINNSPEIAFRQMMSYVTLKVTEVNSETSKLVLSSEKALSGNYTIDFDKDFENGLQAKNGSETLTINLPARKEATISTTFAIPTGEYESLKIGAYDSDNNLQCETEILSSAFNAQRGGLRSLEVTMPKAQVIIPVIEGTVYVAGTYWATGNLQYYEDATQEGFQTNWRLAPQQHMFVNYENMAAVNKAVTFSRNAYTPQYDHFNWGGIKDPFSKDPNASATAAVGTDISGKLFTDQGCTVATTDFKAAKFGDIAFWASNGKYRMPTKQEWDNLTTKASRQYVSVKVGDGKYVTGYLFFDPADGESPTVSEDAVEMTPEELNKGIFLPKAGRRYNAADFNVNVQGTQGVYWGSEAITGDGATEPCYGLVLSIANAAVRYPYWNKAFDAKAGFCVRPVYVK